jgi:hypothetical protein
MHRRSLISVQLILTPSIERKNGFMSNVTRQMPARTLAALAIVVASLLANVRVFADEVAGKVQVAGCPDN